MRTVEPYQLVLKDNHWYFQGYCRSKNDYLLFRLSRMTGLTLSSETFAPQEYQKPTLRFEEILRALQTDITLRVHVFVLDRVLEFCPIDRSVPDGGEYYLVTYPFIERDYYCDQLLNFGSRNECLSPAHVREALRRRVRALAALYGT